VLSNLAVNVNEASIVAFLRNKVKLASQQIDVENWDKFISIFASNIQLDNRYDAVIEYYYFKYLHTQRLTNISYIKPATSSVVKSASDAVLQDIK
jgi:hypothetical protein